MVVRFKGPVLSAACIEQRRVRTDQFENIFSNRNSLEVETHANKGFLDYQSFITASALYQPYGFGTTYMNWTFFGTKEVAAFLAHVASKISCGNKLATMDQLAWGSCYNKKMNSNSNYCCAASELLGLLSP
nr:chitinase-like protein 1 [Quercus suber]